MTDRIRFRTWPSASQKVVELRDVAGRTSYTVDALSAAIRIARGDGLPIRRSSDQVPLSDYESWDSNGWGDALPFYISTLDGKYADFGADYGERHHDVLETYARDEPIPQERYPAESGLPLAPTRPVRRQRLGKVLRARRTTLVPERAQLAAGELAAILSEATRKLAAFRAAGVGDNARHAMVNFGPSLDVYLIVYDVDGLEPGVYRYHVGERLLYLLDLGDLRMEMRTALVGQPAPLTASVSVVYVSDVRRHQWRYRHPRALRGLWIDSAKVVNHLLWALAARGITPHMSPAVADSYLCEILSLEPNLDNEIMYAVTFSGPRPGRADDTC